MDDGSPSPTRPVPTVPCAGGIVRDDRGRILLVRRANEPGRGQWSLPGGRCEPGETPRQACIRELLEECALEVIVDGLAGTVRRPGAVPGTEYEITDFFCSVLRGQPHAGDDADAVCWADGAALHRLPLSDGLLDTLISWRLTAPDT
jgi:mutator protein MutT